MDIAVYTKTVTMESLADIIDQLTGDNELLLLQLSDQQAVHKLEASLSTVAVFSNWNKTQLPRNGIIFNEDLEFRWTTENESTTIRLFRNSSESPGNDWQENLLTVNEITSNNYLLWGIYLERDDENAQALFAENRIPRLIRYPQLKNDPQELQLTVEEYTDPTGGEIIFHRLYGIEGVV